MIARNDDSGSGHFTAKKFVVIHPESSRKVYKIGPFPCGDRASGRPDEIYGNPECDQRKGIWAASGVNGKNVGNEAATETITSNARVLGADPLVKYQPAEDEKKKKLPAGSVKRRPLYITLPYISSARGVIRLGSLLEVRDL